MAEHVRSVKKAREALERAVAETKAIADPSDSVSMGAPPEEPSVKNKHGAPASRVPEYLVIMLGTLTSAAGTFCEPGALRVAKDRGPCG